MCIPTTGSNRQDEVTPGGIPGWTEYVEPLREEALWWHHHWQNCGKPHHGDVAEMHRITRARYHRAIRQIVKDSEKIRLERMAEAIADNRTRDLWNEVRRIKGRNNIAPCKVDGVVGDKNISEVFSEKYKNLYNSVPYDDDEMDSIRTEINLRLLTDNKCSYKISIEDVTKSVNRLKLGKSDGEEGLNSDHIVHGPHLLYVLLTSVINCMLVHGVTPESMIIGTMVPIPKGKMKLLCCSDNYRAITLSSIIGRCLTGLCSLRNRRL